LAAWASICFGIGSIIINLQLNFPLWWTWGEGPFIVGYGVVILWLQKRINTSAGETLGKNEDNKEAEEATNKDTPYRD
jgi:hypothetical protein